MGLEVVCWDDLQASSALLVPGNYGRVSRVAFSLSDNVDNNMDLRDWDLDSSVMIYNYALAVLILRDEWNAIELNDQALSLFKMSLHVLFQMIQTSLVDEVWYLDTPVDRVMGLAIAVVSNLIHSLLWASREEEARACEQNLAYIVQAMSTAEDYIFHLISTPSAAAAA
eukprot:scaffold35500_cov168-Amphora_coffeaeformis.AAC.1